MLYHVFKYFDNVHEPAPAQVVLQYISFRAAVQPVIVVALLIVIVFGRNIINFLRRKQIGEEIRDLGLEGQLQKKGTPTMGGVIILLAILIPVLLFGQLDNVYIQLMLVSTIWLGLIGFLDDYIKVFRHHKEGLKGRFKIVGQVGLGALVGTTMCFSPDKVDRAGKERTEPVETIYLDEHGRTIADHIQRRIVSSESRQTTQTTTPFVKDNEFDYSWLTGGNRTLTWILYVVVAILVVAASFERRDNLTDGLDGLVTGVSAPIRVLVLGILAYTLPDASVYADYLDSVVLHSGQRRTKDRLRSGAGRCAGSASSGTTASRHRCSSGDTGSLSVRRHHRRSRPPQSARSRSPPLLCGTFPGREPLGHASGELLQIHQTQLRRRTPRCCSCPPCTITTRNRVSSKPRSSPVSGCVSLLLAAITLRLGNA